MSLFVSIEALWCSLLFVLLSTSSSFRYAVFLRMSGPHIRIVDVSMAVVVGFVVAVVFYLAFLK